jgi:hypothetical protein
MAEIGVVLLDIQKIPNNLGAVVEVSYTEVQRSDLDEDRPGRDEIIDDFRAAHA